MREEYKQFQSNVSAVEAAFRDALLRCDNSPFTHSPELIAAMVGVASFRFLPDETNWDAEHWDAEHPCIQDCTWHYETVNMQIAVYKWLAILDMPKGALSKFKDDIKRERCCLSGFAGSVDDAYESVDDLNERSRYDDATQYNTLNYFRRLVSIARGFAPAVKEETRKLQKRCAGKYHDDELNENAAKYVFNYSPDDRSFKFKHIDSRVRLTEGQFKAAEILLCGSCDDRGRVSFPSGVRIPTNMKAEAALFFSYVANDGKGHYWITGTVQNRKRGGRRINAGRKVII